MNSSPVGISPVGCHYSQTRVVVGHHPAHSSDAHCSPDQFLGDRDGGVQHSLVAGELAQGEDSSHAEGGGNSVPSQKSYHPCIGLNEHVAGKV